MLQQNVFSFCHPKFFKNCIFPVFNLLTIWPWTKQIGIYLRVIIRCIIMIMIYNVVVSIIVLNLWQIIPRSKRTGNGYFNLYSTFYWIVNQMQCFKNSVDRRKRLIIHLNNVTSTTTQGGDVYLDTNKRHLKWTSYGYR